jgi:cytochrome c5
MNEKDDSVFIKKFSSIIIGLVIVTVVIIALAFSLRSTPDPSANPSSQRFTEERIAPVAGVRVGEDGKAALADAQTQVAAVLDTQSAESAGSESSGASANGKQVYDSVCMACHAAGVAGAPIPGSELMTQRLADKGVDGLVASVINGLNVMPPRGGRADLSDEDIRAAVDFMQQ